MCVLKKVFNIHLTQHDKLDILFTSVTLADILWLLCDAIRDYQHYHMVVGLILFICTLFAINLLKGLCVRHHKNHIKRKLHVVEEQVTYQSEK